MEPQARSDAALILGCIDGLGLYAALRAKENRNPSVTSELRDLIDNLVSYWGLSEGENAKSPEDFLTIFDERVQNAISGAEITDDMYQSCANILNGLYRHGQELVAAQGDSAMGEVLAMGDLIKEISRFFDYESNTFRNMVARLESEVRGMLKDFDLPGQPVNGDNVQNY